MNDGIITTFNEEDFRAILNDIKAHMITASTYGFDSYYDCLMDAGHAIEQLRKERDAAVKDLHEADNCNYCKYRELSGMEEPCRWCDVDEGEDKWEWRGLQNDKL